MSKPLQCFWKAVGKSVCDAKSPKSLCERNSVGGPVPLVISIMFFFLFACAVGIKLRVNLICQLREFCAQLKKGLMF